METYHPPKEVQEKVTDAELPRRRNLGKMAT